MRLVKAVFNCVLVVSSWGFGVSFAGAGPVPAALAPEAPVALEDYWYDRAEVSRYRFTQERYGETRTGEGVLIFVNEPFFPDRQVKREAGYGEGAVPVLKLNRVQEFPTGIYHYQMMLSAFQPSSFKVAGTVSEWCGLVFQQMNRGGGAVTCQLRSYFEDPGDEEGIGPDAWIEDGLWLRLRLAPDSLPVGEVLVYPGLFHQRLRHLAPDAAAALALRVEGELESRYRLEYPALGHALEIRYETLPPHRILGWEETVDGEPFFRAEVTHRERLYYWELNSSADAPWRRQLGLDQLSPEVSPLP